MLRVSHFELPAEDPDRLVEFVKKVFGWDVRKWDGPMDYWLVMTGPEGTPGFDGGIARRGDESPGVVPSIDVPDIDEYVRRIEEAGGTIIAPKMAVPGVGWLAYFKDTEGNTFGIMEEDASVTG
jgi:predicted enzyme related to lactoylglutathione lyase